ncbi:hypothetical protein FOA52_001880 [Chlamydomonas sp. UWO 241]|nr:hypothetical protein FOA52_001880 [Chlamydomonas sp. UWO 241]
MLARASLAHAVFFNALIFRSWIWPQLARADKQNLRCVSKAARDLADDTIEDVEETESGAAAADLRRWPTASSVTLSTLDAVTTMFIGMAGAWSGRLEKVVIKTKERPARGSWGLPSISPQLAARLRHVSLAGCTFLVCVAAIAACTHLQTLDISSTRVNDVSALSGLTQLHTLNLGRSSVTDLTPLSTLTQVTKLVLGSTTTVQDLAPLSTLTLLKKLMMDDCVAVTSIAPLSTLTALRTLDLTYTSRSDKPLLSPFLLTTLTQLTCLTVGPMISHTDEEALRGAIAHAAIKVVDFSEDSDEYYDHDPYYNDPYYNDPYYNGDPEPAF